MHSSQVLKVINTFKKVGYADRIRKSPVNMGKPYVHICHTTHCHGGWYALASYPLRRTLFVGINFLNGANLMANDLGFYSMSELTNWAAFNPKIWGNVYGHLMFCEKKAFTSLSRPEGAKSIKDIINHWEDVYKRLKIEEDLVLAKEQLKKDLIGRELPKVQYNDIRKELSKIPTVSEVHDTLVKELVEN